MHKTAIKSVDSPRELHGILSLQAQNVKQRLSKNAQQQEGFVTVEHSIEQLQKMQAASEQIIALNNESVVGYALVMPPELRQTIPVLIPLFDLLDTLSYKGKALKNQAYYVMGQVCVEKNHRGQGVFRQLYAAHKQWLSSRYDYCITEISSANLRSLNAHQKIGFEILHTFSDATDDWVVVLWDWTR